KRGFAAPIRHWLRRDLKSYLGEVLLTGEPQIGRIFDMDYVEKIVKQHADGTRDYSHHLWLLLMLELWFKEFGG
ncbi:MAG: asparagine synthetase B, partial [Candidatus Omnitrophica bacterium]|nr:asparagine synthetase B [Candidatus Omnitrophota bacterium]